MADKQRYKVVKKIDSGGMAEIFLGQAVSLDGIQRTVAIKRIRPHLANNKRFIQMFIDEARLSMRLVHANITQVFDIGRAQGTYFLVMEFVDGANLRKLVQLAGEKNVKLAPEVAIHIAMEVTKGLAQAHEAVDENRKPLNIVHRDLSPPNVLVSRSGEVKITDFGLAKAKSHLENTEPGVVKGKFSYLSPEACDGMEVDARSDIFSLGIVLHELLSGRRLFLGKTDLETVELVRKCDVPPPSIYNKAIDSELDAVVLRALERDRRKRYQSARDFGDALARYLFSKNMKITTFDISKFVRGLLDEGDASNNPKKVVEIIQEEIVNLSSLGLLPGVRPTEGTSPLEIEAYGGKKTPFADIWAEFENQPRPEMELDPIPGGRRGNAPSQSGGADFSALTHGSSAMVVTKSARRVPVWLWVTAGILGLAAAAAAVAVVFDLIP